MIRIQNLGKYFESPAESRDNEPGSAPGQQRWIFRNIDLHVRRGESVVLIGPSGHGKSLLLKLIAGLEPWSEGKIEVANSNIGMLFQKNALFDSLTVEENLLFPLKERLGIVGEPARARAGHFLAAVGLAGTEALYPDEISGGMQKRLGIARALIVEPEVILYDEPTAGLDPITSKKIAELIQTLRAEKGSTLLTVTNDMQRAYQLGDRICLLARGQLRESGSPDQTQQSQDPAVRQFIFGLKNGPLSGVSRPEGLDDATLTAEAEVQS